MVQLNPVFNPEQYELRGYINPYLTDSQKTNVTETVDRVNRQLDFVAQLLGWSGPNYWDNLATTVNEKRQLLAGTYGVYNNFIIPKIYEIRNWDNRIVIDKLPQINPNKSAYAEYVLVGNDKYLIQSIEEEGDFYVVSLGTLPDSFYTQIQNNVQVLVSVPAYRPAPFRREDIGTSGDNSFFCSANGTSLNLYPGYDTAKKFAYKFPILFAGSQYYFNQPVFLSYGPGLTQDVLPSYDSTLGLWYLSIPQNSGISDSVTAYLVWSYSDSAAPVNAVANIKIQSWVDPSDWNTQSVLSGFRGVWNNKGGSLPFNLVFDALSIHGFNEKNSLSFEGLSRTLYFNDLVERVYSSKSSITQIPPGTPEAGDLWWNPSTGVLAAWVPSVSNCSAWVEIDYRNAPNSPTLGNIIFPNVAAFNAGIGTIPDGSIVTILDISGLSLAENIIGVTGTLSSPATLTMYQEAGSSFWTPVEFIYDNVTDFNSDSLRLPYKIPVRITNSDLLSPSGQNYQIENLERRIFGDYEVVLYKYYTNKNWVLSSDSLLRYIANSSLVGSPLQGEMWWDYSIPTPELRCASIYFGNAWVQVNSAPPTIVPTTPVDSSVIEFYCDGGLVSPSVPYETDHYTFEFTVEYASGLYAFKYTPKDLIGKTKFPKIAISDSLTTAYREDISKQIFGGVVYYMSPNVYDAESPLRVWKAQDLQVAETIAHLEEDNYINPLLADLNNGPGPDNWEKYFIRLPLDYGRNGTEWQKVVLTCQDFGYWGSSIEPEKMLCPPEDAVPAIYEELFLYDQPVPDYTYVYCEPYLYSNLAFIDTGEIGDFRNAGVFPASDVQFDEFNEALLQEYDPLHNRQANFLLPVGQGYGNWLGSYVNINPCVPLTGFYTTDLINGGVQPVQAPVWDASVYKFAPTCEAQPQSFNVDANHYKVGYAYFVADASAAEDGFFDISQEAAWRDPSPQSQSLYLLPR